MAEPQNLIDADEDDEVRSLPSRPWWKRWGREDFGRRFALAGLDLPVFELRRWWRRVR